MDRMPFIRDLQEQGILLDACLPFSNITTARRVAAQNPGTPIVMNFKGSNQGAWLVVSEADAVRMEAVGFERAKATSESLPPDLIGK